MASVTRSSRARGPQARPRPSGPRSARRPAPRSRARATATGSRQPDRPDPRRRARGAGRRPGPGARADPLRADARLAVHLLPRGGGGDGRRPRGRRRRSGITVQACGDAHLSNFGGFAPPDRQLIFDINDFDETLPGPVGVGRQAARREPRDRRPRPRVRRAQRARRRAQRRARPYREQMRGSRRWATSRPGTSASTSTRSASGSPTRVEEEGAQLRQERRQGAPQDRLRAFSKLTTRVDGELRIVSDPPLIMPLEEICSGERAEDGARRAPAVLERVPGDARRRVPQAARPLPLRRRGPQGRRRRQRRHPRLDRPADRPRRGRSAVPADQGGAAVGARAVHGANELPHQGRRVVEGQRMMQASRRHPARLDVGRPASTASGATSTSASSGTRRARPQIDPMTPTGDDDLRAALRRDARPRARPLRRPRRDRLLPRRRRQFDRAMADFATAYADQNERDYAALQAAAADGRITVELEAD